MPPIDPLSSPPSFETFFLRSLLSKRRTWIILLGLVLSLGVGLPLGIYSYRHISSYRFTSLAIKALQEKKIKPAVELLQKALYRNPRNERAVRLMCDLSYQAHSPQAPGWYERLHEIRPEFSTFSSWIQVTMENRQSAEAREALEKNRSRYKNTAEFHAFDSVVCTSENNIPAAVLALERALALKAIPEWKVSLHSLQLQNPDAAIRDKAEAALMEVTSPPKLVMQARFAVMQSRFNHKDHPGALTLALELCENPDLGRDQLFLCLKILAASASEKIPPLTETILKRNSGTPAQWANAAAILENAGLGNQVLLWWEKQDPHFRLQAAQALIAASLYLDQGNKKSFLATIESVNWNSTDYVVPLARDAVSPRREAPDFWRNWANSKQTTLANALQASALAKRWRVPEARESILWELSKIPAMGPDPIREIYHMYRERGDSQGLYRVSLVYQNRYPEDLVGSNNRIKLGLLLDIDQSRCRELAYQNFTKNPTVHLIRATYALSLLLENKAADALNLFSKLPDKSLNNPDLAFYHALTLLANGRKQEGGAALAPNALANVLPEERALWDHYTAAATK